MTLLEALNSAQDKIRSPNNWARGASARDAFGNSTAPSSSDAVSFDIAASIALTVPQDFGLASSLRDLLRRTSNEIFLSAFNDHPDTTHADVMRMFDDARSFLNATQEMDPT